MKLLLDQGTPREAVPLLRSAGHDAVHVGDRGLQAAPDPDIRALAAREGRVVVTLDGDFHQPLAHRGQRAPSVIRLRIEGLRHEDVVRPLLPLLRQHATILEQGSAVSATEGGTRFRRLPLIDRTGPTDPTHDL